MKDENDTYFKDREEFSLTREERTRMRRTVFAYMEMRPRRTASEQPRLAWNFGALFSARPIAALLVLALFVSSAGISYAAQDALPGDFLYAIKTQVNEPLQGALAVSGPAKTAWAMQVAGERIKEAATLAAEGRLSTNTQQEIQANFDAHAEVATAAIVQEASTSPENAGETAVRFEAQLSEYGRVLAQVSHTRDASSSALTSSVNATRDRVAAIRAYAQARAEAAATSTNAGAASRMRDAAQRQLKDSLKLSRDVSDALDASSSAQVALQIESASATISGGEQLLKREADPQANAAFQSALSTAEKLGVFLRTSSAIHARTGLFVGQESGTASSSDQKRGHRSGGGSD